MNKKKFLFGKLNECKISDWKKQMPCWQKEIPISSKCRMLKGKIERKKTECLLLNHTLKFLFV